MHQVACHECDLLVDLPKLTAGQKAFCPRCGYLLSHYPNNCIVNALAFSLAGILFLVLANIFPFLTFEAKGLRQVMTLMQCSIELYRYGNELLAGLVLVFIIVTPAILLCCLIWVLIPLHYKGVRSPGAYWLMGMFFHASPWNMAEVFIIGVLVSLVKIYSLADIELGISFWAYIAFAVCITLSLLNIDRHYIWDRLEEARS